MSLLIGIKKTSSHGSFYGAEGYEGISMKGTITSVIKQDSQDELLKFVKEQHKIEKQATIDLVELQDKLEYDYDMSAREYEKRDSELRSKIILKPFDKLIIVEGITV